MDKKLAGKVDIVVNNAGIVVTKPIGDVKEADYDQLFAINVKGIYFSCQLAAKHSKSQWPHHQLLHFGDRSDVSGLQSVRRL
ncbi:NAD(P)-dependent dehydrogenase (short-subunit alcohol dehydrogenase family) [Bacillus sp. 3255]|nr:NAD(P)-dependent dehydrogenase (short-subunit alcohol dehydrogenase family) [Bacillus sp. 3255]